MVVVAAREQLRATAVGENIAVVLVQSLTLELP